jgi:DNA-binding XRE family transcriptional regulator
MSVYFIQAGNDGPVKIGWAATPTNRLRQMQTASPHPLLLRRVVPEASRIVERWFHRWFAERRLNGEWFSFTDEMLSLEPPTENDGSLGTILTTARHKAGLSQRDVAEAMGISPQYLCDLELNRRPFPVSRVKDLPNAVRPKVAAALMLERINQADELRLWAEPPEAAE